MLGRIRHLLHSTFDPCRTIARNLCAHIVRIVQRELIHAGQRGTLVRTPSPGSFSRISGPAGVPAFRPSKAALPMQSRPSLSALFLPALHHRDADASESPVILAIVGWPTCCETHGERSFPMYSLIWSRCFILNCVLTRRSRSNIFLGQKCHFTIDRFCSVEGFLSSMACPICNRIRAGICGQVCFHVRRGL